MLWSELRSWMDKAELGESNDDREIGRGYVFDLTASKPK